MAARRVLPWVAGFVATVLVLSRFGDDREIEDVFHQVRTNQGHVYLGLAIWATVALPIAWILEPDSRHLPRRRRGSEFPLAYGMLIIIAWVTVPTLGSVLGIEGAPTPMEFVSMSATSLEVVAFLGVSGLVGIVVWLAPMLLRPAGYAYLRPVGAPTVRMVALVVTVSAAAIVAWWFANGYVYAAEARFLPFPPGEPPIERVGSPGLTISTIGWTFVASIWILAIIGWWSGRPRWLYIGLGLLYVGAFSWSGEIASEARYGSLLIGDPTGLIVGAIAATVLLVVAIVAAALFRPGRKLPLDRRSLLGDVARYRSLPPADA